MRTLPDIEPGILPVFRLFMGVSWGLFTFGLCANSERLDYFAWFSWMFTGVLFLYLSWGWLRRQLGVLYLPFALAVATASPIFSEAASNVIRARRGLPADHDAGRFLIWLILPLFLVCAQYRMRTMLAYTITVTLLPIFTAYLTRADQAVIREYWAQGFIRFFLFVLCGFNLVRLSAAQRRQRQELAEKNAQLAHYAATLEQLTISRERNRLARELHDTLAHTLSAINVQLNALDVLWDSSPNAARLKLKQTQELTRSGLDEARRALHALRSSPLDELGLPIALRRVAQTAAERAGAELNLHVPTQLNGIPPDIEQQLYRVAEEALNNVVRHARARRIDLKLEYTESALTLTVRDDGSGFDPSQTAANGHYGLVGMKERAELINGSLEIKSQPGAGTIIQLTVPLQEMAT